MRRRRLKRRLFWTGVILALTLIWLTVQVLRVAALARRRASPERPSPPESVRRGRMPAPS
jgi:cell division protein FtsB